MKAKTKKYIAVSVMVLVAALEIPQIASMIPTAITQFSLGQFGIKTIGAAALLLSAYWVANKEVD